MTNDYNKGWDEGVSGKPFDHQYEKNVQYMNGWLDGYNSAKATKDALEKSSEELVEA